MNRTKIVTLLLAVLVLVAVGHHQLVQMSTKTLNTPLITTADAAILQGSSGAGDMCNGSGTWHFVNNQTGGDCGTGLPAEFMCNGSTVTLSGTQTKCLSSVDQYIVTTTGDCTLVTASTGSVPGKLVLSDFSCVTATPTPTPSPTPTPTP